MWLSGAVICANIHDTAVWLVALICWIFNRPKQQAKLARYCRTILGDMLLTEPLDSHPVCLPRLSFMSDLLTWHVVCLCSVHGCCGSTPWSKKLSPFSFHYSFYKCSPISIIFGTHYIELICSTTVIDLSTSPTYCCCTTLICCFWLSSSCTSDNRAPAAWNSEIHTYRLTASQ